MMNAAVLDSKTKKLHVHREKCIHLFTMFTKKILP